MSTATFTFKCGVIGADGQVDPNGYKFLTWNYIIHEDENNKTMYNIFRKSSHNSLAQRVLSVYPHLADEATKIIYIDEKNDTIVIPCGNVHETVHVLKVINEGDLEDQRSPIRIFIQIVPPPAPVTPVASYPVLRDLHCSICKKELNTKFVYQCLQCESDFTLCGNCETAGKHPEHVVIRFVGEQPNCLPEIKQLVSSTTTHLAVETLKIE